MDEQILEEEELIAEERSVDAARLGAEITRRPIRSLSTLKPPVCVALTASIREAIASMNDRRVGCVLVVREGRLAGVFTERDVLIRVAAKSVDIDRTLVEQVMTPDPECLTLDDRIAYALNMMSVGGFRHIPLIDSEGRPTGVVAMRNIVDHFVDLFPGDVLNLPPSPSLGVTREREGA